MVAYIIMTSPRDRMVASAALLIRERGAQSTAVADVLAHSGAPRGSAYHYFPGGKGQLAAEAVRWADDLTAQVLIRATATGPCDGLTAFVTMWRQTLVDSDFRAGCPILAVAVEELADAAPRDAAVFAFGNWTSLLAGALRAHGVGQQQAMGTATLVVAAVEGAVAMCRAERTTQPLDTVGRELRGVLKAVLERRD